MLILVDRISMADLIRHNFRLDTPTASGCSQAEAIVPLAIRWLASPSLMGINGVALAALRG